MLYTCSRFRLYLISDLPILRIKVRKYFLVSHFKLLALHSLSDLNIKPIVNRQTQLLGILQDKKTQMWDVVLGCLNLPIYTHLKNTNSSKKIRLIRRAQQGYLNHTSIIAISRPCFRTHRLH